MKKVKKHANLTLTSILTTLLVLFYWVWLFYMTQSATPSNTYQSQEIICEVKIKPAYHRGKDKLYIFTQDNCYMLDTGWRNEDSSHQLAEYILSSDEAITVTFWEHFPKRLLDSNNDTNKVQQVVDLRNDCNVYWDLSEHNNYQQRERISGIIAGFFISIIVATFDFFVWYTK